MTINLNATQKNIAMGVATTVVAATPIGPITVFGLIAQPSLAATIFTKGRDVKDKVGQGALGLLISFLAIGTGATINPTTYTETAVAESPAVIAAPAPASASAPASTPTPAPAPIEQVVPVAPTPVVVEAPVEVTYEMTWDEATREMCEAVEQYRQDVAMGRMTRNQAFFEIREYSRHLASKSELDSKTLRDNANYTFQWGARFCFN